MNKRDFNNVAKIALGLSIFLLAKGILAEVAQCSIVGKLGYAEHQSQHIVQIIFNLLMIGAAFAVFAKKRWGLISFLLLALIRMFVTIPSGTNISHAYYLGRNIVPFLRDIGVFSIAMCFRMNGISGWKAFFASDKYIDEHVTFDEETPTHIQENLPSDNTLDQAEDSSHNDSVEVSECSAISQTSEVLVSAVIDGPQDDSVIEETAEFPVVSEGVSPISTVVETSVDIMLPPINNIADSLGIAKEEGVIPQQPEYRVLKESNKQNDETQAKRLFKVKLNLFLYIAIGLFISIQILSIYMDASFISLGRYYWDPIIETWRIVLSSINIALAIVILLWKKGWAFVCLTVISVVSIFMVDSMALKKEYDIRDVMFNFMLFLGAYLPLIITLFLDNQGLSGWQILFGKTLTRVSDFGTLLYRKEAEPAQLSVGKEIDRYTRLYQAISPANFVEPYSPKKVKLANELLEALIKNKDNDVVIALIEEKAKNELGVKLSN